MTNSLHLARTVHSLGYPQLEYHLRDDVQALDLFAGGALTIADITATPPGSPANGDAYIVGTGGTGDWSGHDGAVAFWLTDAAAWQFVTPWSGLRARITDLDDTFEYDATRLKWLGVRLYTFEGGDNALAATSYLLLSGGVRGSATVGFQLPWDFTVVGIDAYKADTSIVINNRFRKNGSNIASLVFSAAGDTHINNFALNNDGTACSGTDALSLYASLTGGLSAPEILQRWYVRRKAT